MASSSVCRKRPELLSIVDGKRPDYRLKEELSWASNSVCREGPELVSAVDRRKSRFYNESALPLLQIEKGRESFTDNSSGAGSVSG